VAIAPQRALLSRNISKEPQRGIDHPATTDVGREWRWLLRALGGTSAIAASLNGEERGRRPLFQNLELDWQVHL